MVRVREMRGADTERVARVPEEAAHAAAETACGDPRRWTRDRAPEEYQDNLADDEAALYVTELDGQIVGFGAADVAGGDVVADYVHPEYQRHGVGTALLNRVELAVTRAGHTVVKLIASVNAESFYVRHGYEVIGRRALDEAEVEFPVVKMERQLLEE